MGAQVEMFSELAARVRARGWCETGLVAVDGSGGAGKSTFAARLAQALGDVPVVHTDDFATGAAGVEWWPRLRSEVIEPLAVGRAATVRRFDASGQVRASRTIDPGDVVVIEGVSSARRAIAPYLTLAIWVHAPREVRLRRGLQRDGVDAGLDWARWMAEEDVHFAADDTLERVTVVVDGCPSIAHDPAVSFIRLDAATLD